MKPETGVSYVCGRADEPLIYDTIGRTLSATAARLPDHEALVVKQQQIRWTYAELERGAAALAAGLLSLGLVRGDRVGIWAPNCAEWVLTQFATAKAGLILVCINPAYRTHELEYALNKVGCAALVMVDRFKTSDYDSMLRQLAPELDDSNPGALHAQKLPALRAVVRIARDSGPGCYAFDRIAELGGKKELAHLEKEAENLQPDDPINIQFTSGTTGSPKGATLTHFNILNNGYFVGKAMRFSERDRLCIPVPFYHCFGMVMGNLNCVAHGATMVVPNDAFDAGLTLKAIHEEKCTALYGVPTMFIAELEHPEFSIYDLSSLRTGIMAGAPCPIEVMRRVTREMHMPEVTIAYGMTETSPVSFQSSTDDPLDKRVTTVGRVHPHIQVKIRDEQGRAVRRGEIGELCTRGYSVMLGYWSDDEQTRQSIDEAGWMHTGDLATLDSDGYCKIVGRLKDMVIRGGENIYPREVEEFLFSHEAIQDVAVFGVPDEKYGEQLCAWIRCKEGAALSEEEVKAYCMQRIARYKVPHYVRFVTEFPMTVTGKIQKFVMRERMIEELGLKQPETA